MKDKVYWTFEEAVAEVFWGAKIMIGGFAGPGGYPYFLVKALNWREAGNLTIIANTAGGIGLTLDFEDHQALFKKGLVKKIIASFPFSTSSSRPTEAEKQILAGKVELELVPQGTLAERIRAGAAGIPAFYTPTGVGTVIENGKEKREFDGKLCLLEYALKADFALIRAHKADKFGNLIYRGTQRNFNPIMAQAANITIAEVDEIVEVGELDPERIETPGIYVQKIVKIKEKMKFPRHINKRFMARR